MTNLIDETGLAAALRGIADQISTAINVWKVNRRIDQIPKPNLLDNWYFPTPINQRGVSGVIKTTGYFIDRWKLVSGQVTLTPDGLLLDGVIQQPKEFAVNQETTATVLTTNGLLESGVEYDDDRKIFQIEAHGETLVAVKLEVGNKQSLVRIEKETVVLNDQCNINDELVKCQRYFIRPDMWSSGIVYGTVVSRWPLPANMRTTPSITIWGKSTRAADSKGKASTHGSSDCKYTLTSHSSGQVISFLLNATNGLVLEYMYEANAEL